MSNKLPTFLIIGAPKSGTTALYEYLRQHPDIYMSPLKEPRFFAVEGGSANFGGPFADVENKVIIDNMDEYRACFDGAHDEKAIGEASTLYLASPIAPLRIRQYIPDVRLVAILRDPIERAFSGYLMNVMQKRETSSFEEAIEDEPRRLRENWYGARYLDAGHYSEQIRRYLSAFPKEQLKVYLYDDLKDDTHGLLEDLFNFLDVDPTFEVNTSWKHNVSGIPTNRLVDAVIGQRPSRYWLRRMKPYVPKSLVRLRHKIRRQYMYRPQLDPETRARLIPRFKDDILWLQDFLDRDLSAWMSVERSVQERAAADL